MKTLPLTYLTPLTVPFKNKQPFSTQFDDVYYSGMDGLQESNHVFIHHNQLIERWQQAATKPSFCIAETGFGTGLNFLATYQAWQNCNPRPERLFFISVEKYPLSVDCMQQALQQFPQLQALSQQLISKWGNYRHGIQHMLFDDGVELTLCLGDATQLMSQLNASVDVWFLDGFAPGKNPGMWQEPLFEAINRLSKPTTTLATFTAASAVRNYLTAHGFAVTKVPGFGHKREMITARFEHPVEPQKTTHNWSPIPAANIQSQQATVLGGGIAGMCLAHSFKMAGFETTVVDQRPHPMQETSGNAMAMMMPLLTAQDSPESLFYLRAFDAALAFYTSTELQAIGVKQILPPAKHAWAKSMAKAQLPASLIEIKDEHVIYPTAGYVDTRALAARLDDCVDQWLHQQVIQIRKTDSGLWQLLDRHGKVIHQCELLVIANGIQAQRLLPDQELSLVARHGQTSMIQVPKHTELKHILLQDGYIVPHINGNWWLCGATFDHVTTEQLAQPAELSADHWQRNRAMWENHIIYSTLASATMTGGHAAIRATTPDHLPLCGPLIDQSQFIHDYQDLHHGRHWQQYPPAQCLENLYMLNGLGSRGYTSAPLLARYLTAMILAEPLPLEADLCKIIHPNRFLYRRLKKSPQQR